MDNITNIYISGPITGRDNYLEEFKAAEDIIRESFPNAGIINPAEIMRTLPKTTTYEQYMNLSFELLEMATVIIMIDDWEKSSGANREYGYARAKDMTILELAWLRKEIT